MVSWFVGGWLGSWVGVHQQIPPNCPTINRLLNEQGEFRKQLDRLGAGEVVGDEGEEERRAGYP